MLFSGICTCINIPAPSHHGRFLFLQALSSAESPTLRRGRDEGLPHPASPLVQRYVVPLVELTLIAPHLIPIQSPIPVPLLIAPSFSCVTSPYLGCPPAPAFSLVVPVLFIALLPTQPHYRLSSPGHAWESSDSLALRKRGC